MQNTRIILSCLILLGLISCKQTQQTDTIVMNPIMPIHYTGDTTHIYLTDYLPQLSGEEDIFLETDNNYATYSTCPMEFNLIGNNSLSNLRVTVKSNVSASESVSVDIPLLPNLPYAEGLTTLTCDAKTITLQLPADDLDIAVYIDNELLNEASAIINLPDAKPGRSFLRVFAASTTHRYNDILVPLHNGQVITDPALLNRHDDQTQVLYSILVDRFSNGNTNNDAPLNDPDVLPIVDYMGGDLKGITNKINEGFFNELGITTLWISPITQNPTDAWGHYEFQPLQNGLYNNKYDQTKSYTKFSGYHGYWPIYNTAVDTRMGTDDDLRELLDAAHHHNMNVVLDYVANHLHINSPTIQQHPEWITDSILPDGRRNFELWDEARLTTWFDTHIPSLDLERIEVCQAMTDTALFWLDNFDLDGYRHDACKHIPEQYWRLIGHKIATRYPTRHIWMIGETYGSPELIGGYVKTGMLSAQFDFNVYWGYRDLMDGKTGIDELAQIVRTGHATYGSHHTMGNISGNHDQVRIASVAGGAILSTEDGKEAGWTRNIGIGNAEQGYRRALMLEALNMTLPGVPCLYQGDEYGEVGGNDPDNRHPMRFDGLNDNEQAMRREVQRLIALRKHSMPLLYGDMQTIECTPQRWVYTRTYMGQTITVTLDITNYNYSIE